MRLHKNWKNYVWQIQLIYIYSNLTCFVKLDKTLFKQLYLTNPILIKKAVSEAYVQINKINTIQNAHILHTMCYSILKKASM
jgi:hypothetical protein